MAMSLCEGRPLTGGQGATGNGPEAWLKAMLIPLLEAVETLHDERIYHRDIAPDNVVIQENGAPILLDFGAPGTSPPTGHRPDRHSEARVRAHRAICGRSVAEAGPVTDIYALSAVVYFAMTGKTPPNSVARLIKIQCSRWRARMSGGYAPEFLGAIDAALSIWPDGRPQSIAEFRSMLGLPAFTPALRPRTRTSPASTTPATPAMTSGSGRRRGRRRPPR